MINRRRDTSSRPTVLQLIIIDFRNAGDGVPYRKSIYINNLQKKGDRDVRNTVAFNIRL